MSSKSFAGVAVGLPSKVRGSEAEEEWQEVSWIDWSTGELQIDVSSFALVFKPSGSGSISAKPLGSLVGATGVDAQTLIVKTTGAIHLLYRFTFRAASDAGEFSALAAIAENPTVPASSQSSAATRRGASSREASILEAELQVIHSSRLPLVYAGVEVYGPDPFGEDASSEVLLGRGALVLLDPSDEEASGRVGTYELRFHSEDDGASVVTKRFTIGQQMGLRKRQASKQGDGRAASYELPSGGIKSLTHVLTFDCQQNAAAFARDYGVRQKLIQVAWKTAQGATARQALRHEIAGLKSSSVTARCVRFLAFVCMLLTLLAILRYAMLLSAEPGRPPAAIAGKVLNDALSVLRLSREQTGAAFARGCQLLVGAIPAAEALNCTALASKGAIQDCIEALAGKR